MHELAPLIYDLAIMLGLAGIVVVIFQRIRQPIVLGYLVAGMIVGPYTPPYALVKDVPSIQILSVLGVIFLMFTLGLEFSFRRLMRVGFSASVTGFLEVMFMMMIGYVTGKLLGWSYYDSLFLGAALSISSTTIIIKAIDELNLGTKAFAELIFGVLVVEDLLAILILVGLSTLVATEQFLSVDMVFAAIKLILVVGGWFIGGYFIVPSFFRQIAAFISEETLTIISVALCLFLVCVAVNFHYSAALGAFIMGSILAETNLVHRIESLMRPIRDIFGAVFFISVGMLIDPRVIVNHWQAVLLISLVTIFGKIIMTSLAALSSGQNLNTSVRVGFGMAQVGEFSFIIAALGVSLKVTHNTLYPIIVAVSGITTFTTPYFIRFSGFFSNVIDNHLPEQIKQLLTVYSSWVSHSLSTTKHKKHPVGAMIARLVVNGIIVASIFILVDELLFFKLKIFSEDSAIANVISLMIALCLSSPFIWGMMFSYRSDKNVTHQKLTFNSRIFIIWLITFSEISLLSIVRFNSWLTILFLLVMVLVFILFLYKHFEKSYHWLEKQLIRNVRKDK